MPITPTLTFFATLLPNTVFTQFLTCNNTGDLGHETFDGSDGHAFRLVLYASDDVFNLKEKHREEKAQHE